MYTKGTGGGGGEVGVTTKFRLVGVLTNIRHASEGGGDNLEMQEVASRYAKSDCESIGTICRGTAGSTGGLLVGGRGVLLERERKREPEGGETSGAGSREKAEGACESGDDSGGVQGHANKVQHECSGHQGYDVL